MKKQTAVEWLAEQVASELGFRIKNASEAVKMIEKALQMEKEQIVEAHDAKFEILDRFVTSDSSKTTFKSGEQYYEETYGK